MASFFRNKWVRFLGPLVILALVAYMFRDQMPFLAEGYHDMLAANPVGLICAFIAVFLAIVVMAEVMRSLLGVGSYDIPLSRTLNLTLISNAWSSTFPGGAAISTVYQFRTMRKWGVSVVIVSWFIVVSSALSTVWLIALGLIAVFYQNANFSLYPLIGSAVIMIGLAALVYWATNHPHKVQKLSTKVLRTFNKLFRRPQDKGIAELNSQIEQLGTVHFSLSRFNWVALLSLLKWLLEIAGLWFCVWAVTDHLPAWEKTTDETTILGITLAFVTSKVVGTAQVTPAGLGPVEAALTASLVATGLPASNAFASVFIYRILSFALITLIGWILYYISIARGAPPMKAATTATTPARSVPSPQEDS